MVETRRSIDLRPHLDLNASVLREALFCDAHRSGHDLEPADDRRLQFLRRRLHLVEHAIDPETDPETFLERLEVDVARADFVRFDEEERDEPDDRRVAAIAFRKFGPFGDIDFLQRRVADLLAQDVDGFLRTAVILDQAPAEFSPGGADQLDLAFLRRKLRLSMLSKSSGSPVATTSRARCARSGSF
jgi:hypothetical protein